MMICMIMFVFFRRTTSNSKKMLGAAYEGQFELLFKEPQITTMFLMYLLFYKACKNKIILTVMITLLRLRNTTANQRNINHNS